MKGLLVIVLIGLVSVTAGAKRVTEMTEKRRGRGNRQGEGEGETIMDKLLRDNSKSQPPRSDDATIVKIGVFIFSITNINVQSMEYTMSYYLRQSWNDPRLAFKAEDDMTKKIRVNDRDIMNLWRPDTFIRNELRKSEAELANDNTLLFINNEGDVWFVQKITSTVSCPMRLQKFPHDTQYCPLMFESFCFTMDTMYFVWLDSPVDIDSDMMLPEYTLRDKILYDCSKNYKGGAFACLEIRFVFVRDSVSHILQYYLPISLVVILSWISFWINIPAVDIYGIITFLILATCVWNTGDPVAKVSYIKAIDIWTFMCVLFLFAVLLESVVVSLLSQRAGRQLNRKDGEKDDISTSVAANRIVLISKVAFPISFLLFNIIYVAVYTL